MGNHVMLMKLEQFGGLKRSEWQGKEAADVAIPVARALKEAFLRMPANIRGLPGAYGIYAPQGVGLQELTQNSVQDQGSLAKMYAQFKKQDALDSSTQQAWTNFVKKMEAIGTQLENLFAKSLKTLSGPLSDFAKSLVKATGIILDSPLMKNIIKGAGRVVESGAKYLASPQFETDMNNFITELQDIGSSMMTVVGYLESWFGKTPEQSATEASKKMRNSSNIGTFQPGEAQRLINQIPGNTTVNVNIDGDLIASKRQKTGNMSENTFSQAYSAASGNLK